jgi:hypothetical protein
MLEAVQYAYFLFLFYSWSCRLLVRFCLLPSARPGFAAFAEVPTSVCHIDYLCREMVWTSSLVHQLGPVGGGWFWGWGLEPMYTTHIHFHPLHFYNLPKNLLFLLGSHNRKTCRSARALGDNEQGVEEGGAGLRARGILISLRYENMGVCLSFAHPSYRFLFVSQTRSLGRAR